MVLLALSAEPEWKVRPFVKKNHIDYIVASDAEKTVKEYGISGYPTILILDPDGEVKWKGSSTLMADEVLKDVLKESPPKPGGILEEKTAEAALKQAERYLKQKKYAKAYKAFRKLSKQHKHTKAGKTAKAKLKEIMADAQIMAAIETRDLEKDCTSWLETAAILLGKGEAQEAARYYRRIIRKYPDSDYAKQAKKKLESLAKKD